MKNKEPLRVEVLVIAGEKKITELMQACDMFSKDKVIGERHLVILEFTNGVVKSKRKVFFDIIIKNIKENFETEHQSIVSLVHIKSYQQGNTVTINDGWAEPFINKKVRQISDGKNFSMFHGILSDLKIKFKTNEQYFIQ